MGPTQDRDETSALSIGWRMNSADEPTYWLQAGSRPGFQPEEELVKVPASTMATHTAIIGQSGSGKSAFLGRLVEELLLKTKGRCLIFDPNSDFRRLHEVEDAKLWTGAAYQKLTGEGRLPDEKTQADFATAWSKVELVMRGKLIERRKAPYGTLQIWWPSLSVEFIAENLDTLRRSELYHCHAYLQAVADLAKWQLVITGKPLDVIETSESLWREASSPSGAVSTQRLGTNLRKLSNKLIEKPSKPETGEFSLLFPSTDTLRMIFESVIRRAVTAIGYVSEQVIRFYFAKAREYRAAGMLQLKPPLVDGLPSHRVEVIDLPSLPGENLRLLAVNSTLATEWARAREAWEKALQKPPKEDTRVPTFVILDEAHNMLPAEPTSEAEIALREQFRTIAAEGRKYGLFLILASQRPDKLDSVILSECGNKVVMRLDSKSILDVSKQLLGLEEVPSSLLEKTLGFRIGRALLVGRWVPAGPQILYTAARRTIEGGRNLRASHWAQLP